MSEVTFAKSFLATLDRKPIRLPADHVSDPRSYPSQSPYILPKQTHPFPRKTVPAERQQARSKGVTATLKPMRGGETVTITDLTLDSTVHEIKSQYAQQSGRPQEKIKLLLHKKPAADLKTLNELGVSGESVELSVMIIGGGGGTGTTSPPATVTATTPPAAAPSADKMDIDEKTPAPESEKAQVAAESRADPPTRTAEETLKSDEFWTDLRAYLVQRLRDETVGEQLAQLFREAQSRR